jgi:HAD superfamily hydrolase (TIGR01509 family)
VAIRALIFDFDGLILETEGPSYQSWRELYRSFGLSLPFSTWSSIIGTTQGEFDPRLELQKQVQEEVNWEALELQRQAIEQALIEAQPVLPGVVEYLRKGRELGLKIGLASSSSCRWVMGHLARLGLEHYFDCIRGSDDVRYVKPQPELYYLVLKGLGVRADEAIALEDSPLGIEAAKKAGVYCVVVPNALTRQLDLSLADLQLRSLSDMPLRELIKHVNGG